MGHMIDWELFLTFSSSFFPYERGHLLFRFFFFWVPFHDITSQLILLGPFSGRGWMVGFILCYIPLFACMAPTMSHVFHFTCRSHWFARTSGPPQIPDFRWYVAKPCEHSLHLSFDYILVFSHCRGSNLYFNGGPGDSPFTERDNPVEVAAHTNKDSKAF